MNSIKLVDGLPLPSFFDEDKYYLMRNLSPRPNDIIVSTFPKCGTNWVVYIIWGILHPEEPAPETKRVQNDMPVVEYYGLTIWEDSPKDQARTLVTHLPPNRQQMSSDAKYVVVIRNPLDCCVSYYHFWKDLPEVEKTTNDPDSSDMKLTPGIFLDHFLKGETPYGNFFRHVKSWYELRNQENIHMVIFEKLKMNSKEEISKLATFLGHEQNLVANDGKLLDKIVEQSSFTVMKKNLHYIDPVFKGHYPLLRNGKIGGYRDTFTPQEIDLVKNRMEDELAGTELLEIWRNV